MIQIREAKPQEASSIVDFQIRMAQETEDLVLTEEKLMPGSKAIFEDRNKGVYYVAVDGDKVVGCLLITYEWSEWRNGTVLWIQSVYVLPEYRGQKVFRMLYEHIQNLVETNEDYYVGPTWLDPPVILFGAEFVYYQALVVVILPLPVGEHEIVLHSYFADFGDVFDNIWNIKVIPKGKKGKN